MRADLALRPNGANAPPTAPSRVGASGPTTRANRTRPDRQTDSYYRDRTRDPHDVLSRRSGVLHTFPAGPVLATPPLVGRALLVLTPLRGAAEAPLAAK